MNFAGTLWAFLPALIAIALALITKQVYLSLFIGIFTGAMLLVNFNPINAITTIFSVMSEQLGGNGGILVFLVVLGIFAVLMVKTGGSKAYGEWGVKRIKSKKGALLSTVLLGCLIFVDDYFNCLTVGSVMRPVTDKHKISRAKLAYIIDATAAPVCIIAPISSWAAAVTGFLGSDSDGILDFVKTIPFNLYAVLTIAMMLVFILLKLDFGKMRKNEINAENGDLFSGQTDLPVSDIEAKDDAKGKISYLVFPIVILILCCVGSMAYNGYIGLEKSGNLLDWFSNCDSGLSLAVGSTVALIITIIYYACVKALSFKECMNSLTEGFKSMVPAILILVFAWTLCAIMGAKGGNLDAQKFVETHVTAENMTLGIIPAVFFVLACIISFSTGTSWGTFGVLIPISLSVMNSASPSMLYLTMAAVLSGAVFGDHVSPISDTTIMASSGAQCNHIDHVKTQLPYAGLVAIIAFVSYIISGFITSRNVSYGISAAVTLGSGAVIFVAAVVVLKLIVSKQNKKMQQ